MICIGAADEEAARTSVTTAAVVACILTVAVVGYEVVWRLVLGSSGGWV